MFDDNAVFIFLAYGVSIVALSILAASILWSARKAKARLDTNT